MSLGGILRRHWPETLLTLAVALPWLLLLVLGMVWLWQSGYTWAWALTAAALGALAWPLVRLVRKRSNIEMRPPELAEPSQSWNVSDREAWSEVLKVADTTTPFSFTEIDPILSSAGRTVDAVARRLRPASDNAWAQFTLPEVLLLTERVSRDLRGTALRFIPGAREITLSRVLWFKSQYDRYGPLANAIYRIWRVVRVPFNPVAAAGNEFSRLFGAKTTEAVSHSLRARATQEFVLAVGRAAIDLYSGRLALSDEELRAAAVTDTATAAEPTGPVRIILVGQVNAGKSSLVNALAEEARCAVGPVPTTARVTEYRLELEGRPAVLLVDMPGLGDDAAPELLRQAERADLVLWVVSATQSARAPDHQGLDEFRAWTRAQLARRPPPLVVALTHVDALRPGNEWAPPYDVAVPAGPKARSIRAAIDAVARALELAVDAIVPVAMPPGREPYNMGALWARIAIELPEAKLVQLDRLRVGAARTSLRELAGQLGNTGRVVMKAIAGANLS